MTPGFFQCRNLISGEGGRRCSRSSSAAFVEADIDQLLASGERVTLDSGGSGGAFSKASFTSDAASTNVDLNDPTLWQTLLPKKGAASPSGRGARRRGSAVVDVVHTATRRAPI